MSAAVEGVDAVISITDPNNQTTRFEYDVGRKGSGVFVERERVTVKKLFVHIVVLLSLGILVVPVVPHADQAQYFYDELGRLVGVVDGQGNTAVYVYDEVGNLLRIDRFAGNTAGVASFLGHST